MIYVYIDKFLEVYIYVIIARCILSFFPYSDNSIVRFIYEITEPVMTPFRKLLPSAGGFDFSPILVIFLIGFLRNILRGFM